ncbi:uncharacterized protein LOC130809256 isoform X2 [Amaranthus tricolor]|uniref:uncharacterized protein LOC130809256 isoform X2 n=1 Tax=Amaranthus tricolor TaxID=29722 RepID=UPI002589655A|nr:uncharacterized protein LOC130809256 isoform X2 [Amaranthus tricolor]
MASTSISIPTSNLLQLCLLNKKPHLFIIHCKYNSIPPSKGASQLNIRPLYYFSSPAPIKPSADRNSDNQVNLVTNFDFGQRPVKTNKTVLWVLFWTSVSLVVFAFSKDAKAVGVGSSSSSIKASSFGLKVASFLRGSGWTDEAIVFALATLPVIELRGAIPVGYWMQLHPALLTVLSILGNMIPVPFIILYLKKFANFVAGKNHVASRVLDMLFKRAKEKAGPVEEFQWLGLMLFVAVPFPGTGAWTGAIIASVLDMPFWSALSANFFGVVSAGLLVNLLVNLGLKYAIITGLLLFLVSTFMWSLLRKLSNSLNSHN